MVELKLESHLSYLYFDVQHHTHGNLDIGEMEEFLNQISLNLDQSNFTLAKEACLMLGSQKSLIHDEFGKK